MNILDLDMDFFIRKVARDIPESSKWRATYLSPDVWNEEDVRAFLEENLGLSRDKKIPGRIVKGHNEALFFWHELILDETIKPPFEVVHVDSHADLGLGSPSLSYIEKELLGFSPENRPYHTQYEFIGNKKGVGIGDYLLYAIAFQWIEKLTYCANPNGECDDYPLEIIKDFKETPCYGETVTNSIELLYNSTMDCPILGMAEDIDIQDYLANAKREPAIPFVIIPTIKDVHFDGTFDYAVLAQSPNYTPANADYIINVFREYIDEI